jgi:L-lysine 2,3-aminomutase
MLNRAPAPEIDVDEVLEKGEYPDEARQIIAAERLLPGGLVNRLHRQFLQYSSLARTTPPIFKGQENYTGLKGFRRVVEILRGAGIDIGHVDERELFIEVYRFLATRHTLNSIDWTNYEADSVFQLVFPQPGMIAGDVVQDYLAASKGAERTKVASEYMKATNPHDGNQQLNKPWFKNEDGGLEVLAGSQHKYPQTQLIFDKSTQHCFSFCTYCFRHAQVRGDEDMFLQHDIAQIHEYLRQHKEVTDLLITGGDGGFMPPERLAQYVEPLFEDPELLHIRTVRLATRVLTFSPELVLTRKYEKMLSLFDRIHENGIQLAWMAHFSTPKELLNPMVIAATRRLQGHGVVMRSQSPMMKHISLFARDDGSIDIDRSAQNWIDLANILGTLHIGFHSMYCARPTGEHHYYTAPLADVVRIFDQVYRSLPSINRPSRHISMTTSAGKMSLMGFAQINGETVFALKFNEARNMKWMDTVFHAKYDAQTNNVSLLTPVEGNGFFFEEELAEIEAELERSLNDAMASAKTIHMDHTLQVDQSAESDFPTAH